MIKYHDNIHGQQYGADHALTDNWNPKGTYREDEYINVHIRLDVPAYKFVGGWYEWESEDQRAIFFDSIRRVLESFNIPEETFSHIRDKELPPIECLYIHPADISGTLRKGYVEKIAEALNELDGVKVRWVDLYHDVSPMTNAEYKEVLDGQRDRIEQELLEVFKTKRRNLYITSVFDAIDRVSERYNLPRRECKTGHDYFTHGFVGEVFESLVKDGKILTAETRNGTGYRTATAKDKAA